MLILSYFDRITGPKILLTSPPNLKDRLDEKAKQQIKSQLDTSEKGFFTHYFSPELKTANWLLSIPSPWARGRNELLMVTAIISEEEPDLSFYESILSKFVGKIKNVNEIYKGLYINTKDAIENEEIQEMFKALKQELDNLYKILMVKRVETEGKLLSFETLKTQKNIAITSNLINKIEKKIENMKNCFIVYRARGKSIKIDLIPVETDRIIKLSVFFGERMSVTVLQKVSQIFSKHEDEVSMVFTSGICQELDKCIYEVYIKTDMENLNDIINEIYKVSGVLEIDLNLIKLDSNQ
jgi:hypothetical protein